MQVGRQREGRHHRQEGKHTRLKTNPYRRPEGPLGRRQSGEGSHRRGLASRLVPPADGDRLPPTVAGGDRPAAVDIHQLRAGHWTSSSQWRHRVGLAPSWLSGCNQCDDRQCRAALYPSAERRRTAQACPPAVPGSDGHPTSPDGDHQPQHGGGAERQHRGGPGGRPQVPSELLGYVSMGRRDTIKATIATA